jgi:hypothetical protein
VRGLVAEREREVVAIIEDGRLIGLANVIATNSCVSADYGPFRTLRDQKPDC